MSRWREGKAGKIGRDTSGEEKGINKRAITK